jgi:C4-type Zn-finger protein
LNEEQRDSHKCMERALESNCPVCSEWMHSSTLPCTRLRCGHFMHESCLNDYVRNSHNYNCPVCSRSILADSQRSSISRSIEAFVRRNRV